VAFALQADGWWLRSDIIWSKPNPMPESVTDRPTKSHEYIFLLTRSDRYFYDADAIREKAIEGTDLGLLRGRQFNDGEHVAWHAESIKKRQDAGVDSRTAASGRRNARTVWTIATQPFSAASLGLRVDADGNGHKVSADCPIHGDDPIRVSRAQDDGRLVVSRSGRNQRSGDRPDESPEVEHVPIETTDGEDSRLGSSDSQVPAYAPIATGHSNETHKTDLDPSTSQHDSGDVESAGRTDDIEPSRAIDANDARTHESNIAAGFFGDVTDFGRTVEKPDRNAYRCTCLIIDHFAVFPEELARRCIKAGTSDRGQCPECGAPWVRVVEHDNAVSQETPRFNADRNDAGRTQFVGSASRTTGWRSTCKHDAEPLPQVVLDPFLGSGTTALVAKMAGRDYIGIELNAEYVKLAEERIGIQQERLL